MYVSSTEVEYVINKFIQKNYISHRVNRLYVHLEVKQGLKLKYDFKESDIFKRMKFMTWFELNKHTETERKYLYSEIPNNYKFDK